MRPVKVATCAESEAAKRARTIGVDCIERSTSRAGTLYRKLEVARQRRLRSPRALPMQPAHRALRSAFASAVPQPAKSAARLHTIAPRIAAALAPEPGHPRA